MASVQRYSSRGRTYWRVVESFRRADGHPATRTLRHLGSTADLLAQIEGATAPTRVRSVSVGAVEALARLAEEFEVAALLDRTVGGRGRGVPRRDGLTVGQSLTAAAIARLCHPCSKRALATWAETTSLPAWLGVSADVLTSQHFWDQMDAVPVEAIPEAETQIVARVLAREVLQPALLAYDTTNFYTHLASTNERSVLAQRGHNKQKRHDLRQLGLALVVSDDGQIPLGHVLYDGARPDVRTFAAVLAPVRQRLARLLPTPTQLTLVFDEGGESQANLEAVRGGPVDQVTHYVTALKPSAHRAWLAEVAPQLTALTLGSGESVRVWRGERPVHGVVQTVVVVWSSRLAEGQRRGLAQQVARALRDLAAIKPQPLSARRALEQRVRGICHRQYLRECLRADVVEQGGRLVVTIQLDTAARERLETTFLGLRLLTTTRAEWTTAQILEAYRGQARVERAFRDLKDPWVGAFRPQYHWTDQKLRVHALIAVLSLLLGRVLLRRAQTVGFEGSLRTLVERLSRVRRVTLLYAQGHGGRPRVTDHLEDCDDQLKALAGALGAIPAVSASGTAYTPARS